MNKMQMAPSGWKKKIVHEVVEYWIIFGYLAFFLVAFIWYRRLVLAHYQVHYTNYWFPLIEAAVLAKVIMIGDYLRLGRGLEQKPLILPVLYRTVMFSVWVGIFSVLEATVRGLLHGKGLTGGLEEIVSKGLYELLSWCVVIFVAFVPFFAFKEPERVLAGLGLISLDERVRLVGGVSRSILNRSVAQAYEYRFHWKETKQRLELRSL